jgi:hypothetical protein
MSKPLDYIACYATVHLHERKYINSRLAEA